MPPPNAIESTCPAGVFARETARACGPVGVISLPAELITLSGCGTGLNVVVGGDELMGLKRGLLYAGAQGLLLTLWDVHDQSTAEFMKLFYGRLQTNPNKAQAAQYAMDEIRRTYAHPFYWAPFILVGKYN